MCHFTECVILLFIAGGRGRPPVTKTNQGKLSVSDKALEVTSNGEKTTNPKAIVSKSECLYVYQ